MSLNRTLETIQTLVREVIQIIKQKDYDLSVLIPTCEALTKNLKILSDFNISEGNVAILVQAFATASRNVGKQSLLLLRKRRADDYREDFSGLISATQYWQFCCHNLKCKLNGDSPMKRPKSSPILRSRNLSDHDANIIPNPNFLCSESNNDTSGLDSETKLSKSTSTPNLPSRKPDKLLKRSTKGRALKSRKATIYSPPPKYPEQDKENSPLVSDRGSKLTESLSDKCFSMCSFNTNSTVSEVSRLNEVIKESEKKIRGLELLLETTEMRAREMENRALRAESRAHRAEKMVYHLEIEQKMEELLSQIHPGNLQDKNYKEALKQLKIEEKLTTLLSIIREDKKKFHNVDKPKNKKKELEQKRQLKYGVSLKRISRSHPPSTTPTNYVGESSEDRALHQMIQQQLTS